MQIIHDDMWRHGGLKLVTTNSFIRKDGALVMGRGAAKEAAERLPQLPFLAGRRITHLGVYGLIVFPDVLAMGLAGTAAGLFQVKRHYADNADLHIIAESTFRLGHFAQAWGGPICLNYPGIGFGRLSESQVEPIIRSLPDNVFVFTYPDQSTRR